ncbi:hypothetical protein [Streptomyces europaeiscabiei]|uniref:hypothetical protein n=1 Tax=Streptomyces europaeiscabiei TaxID=146819 RepID=UPI002E182B45
MDLQQRGRLADHVRGGLVAGRRQPHAGGEEFGLGEPFGRRRRGALHDQHAEQILARLGPLRRDEFGHVPRELREGGPRLLLRETADVRERVGPVREAVARVHDASMVHHALSVHGAIST